MVSHALAPAFAVQIVLVLLYVVGSASSGLVKQGTGTVTGIVVTDATPDARPVAVTTDQAVCGNQVEDRVAVVDSQGGVANAVIIVTGAPWGDVKPEPVINNAGCYFVPRVQVAATRSLVKVTSEDDTLHTTHAYDDRQRTLFNIAIPVPGIQIERPLRRPGPVRIECDSHGWMRGWVYVTDDVGAVSGPDGRFELTGIPAGSYSVKVWHELYGERNQQVTVTAGGVTEISFNFE